MVAPPGSAVHGILQARILEWVAISFSRRSSQPRDRTQVSSIAKRHFTIWATREAQSVTMEGRNQKEERIQPSSRKEFNFPWSLGKGDLKHNTLKKKIKGREILHKWRDKLETQKSNKWRGNRQTTWKRIQNNNSKDDQKPWKQNGENARNQLAKT